MTTDKRNIVYKYHRINQHLLDLIRTGQLWFSHQNELNDPFDCKYALSESYLMSLFKNSTGTLLKDLQDRLPQFKDLCHDEFFKIMLPTLKSDGWMNGFYNMLFGDMLGWSVCCFTTDPLNELMWAHYADNNKGVCLEFDLTKSPDLHEKLNPVDYNDTFPEINSMDELPKALLTKRTAWTMEYEWRILSNVKGAKAFDKNSLTAVYFGCYVTKKTIDDIRQYMISYGYKKVAFKQLDLRIKGVTIRQSDTLDDENHKASM